MWVAVGLADRADVTDATAVEVEVGVGVCPLADGVAPLADGVATLADGMAPLADGVALLLPQAATISAAVNATPTRPRRLPRRLLCVPIGPPFPVPLQPGSGSENPQAAPW